MTSKYPQYRWKLVTQTGRRYPQCRSCKKIPAKKEKYYFLEIRHDIFRGNDEVKYYCLECGDKLKKDT